MSSLFPCNTCSVTFESNELQRAHMHLPWHIDNLRRKVAKLPALTEEQYAAKTKEPKDLKDSKSTKLSKAIPDSIPEPDPNLTSSHQEKTPNPPTQVTSQATISPQSTQCLFCPTLSADSASNLTHMSTAHSLFIPSPDQLSDLDSFLGYLALIVFTYHECLYCGLEKGSVESVQTHMRDKGHCMIRLDQGSELLDFWEEVSEGESEGRAVDVGNGEMRLASGAVVTSRLEQGAGSVRGRVRGQYRRRELNAITSGDEEEDKTLPSRDQERRVAVRGEMGLIGVSDAQRRALVLTEQKMKRREALTKAAQRHAIEQQPVKVKYYKTENPIYQAG